MPVLEKEKLASVRSRIEKASSKLLARLTPEEAVSPSDGAPVVAGHVSRWADPSKVSRTHGTAAEIGQAIREFESAIREIKGLF